MSAVRFFLSAALAAALAGASASAQQSEGPEWIRSASEDGQFSVETPCTAEQIAELAKKPAGIMGAAKAPGRVVCKYRGVLFSAAVRTAPIKEGFKGPSAFDIMLGMARAKSGKAGEIVVADIGGRRAVSNDEIDGKIFARTTIVELAPNAILMLVSGGPFEPGYAVDEIKPMVDRFVASLEFGA